MIDEPGMINIKNYPYMIWKCPHKTTVTETKEGANPICKECQKLELENLITDTRFGQMDFLGTIPKGCVYVWAEHFCKS